MDEIIDVNQNKIKVAGIYEESDANGPGIRYVIFTQGCPHHCPGCHNPETHDFNGGGYYKDIDEIVAEIRKNPLLEGVTFSGGDPFMQAEKMGILAEKLHKYGYNIMTYTGYTFEQLLTLSNDTNHFMDLLSRSDILVDGKFVEALKDEMNNEFKGSTNQRIIDVKVSLLLGMVKLKDIRAEEAEPTKFFKNKYVQEGFAS